jgi:hypothetical protein
MNMKSNLVEGFKDDSTPDMKYYAFDWDDNIVYMPTKIMLVDSKGEEVGMGTEDFAEYRTAIGVNEFKYKGHTIVGFSKNPFRNFRTEGDKKFITDAMKAEPGPAFSDFKEAINNGSIFSIITARGHSPNILRQAVYNYIISDYEGIEKKQLLKNLKKFRDFVGIKDSSEKDMIEQYLDLCKFYPVTFGDEKSAVNPEIAKVMAMKEFVSYVKEMSSILNKRTYLKSDLGNKFIPSQPTIGFSDDDIKNVEMMDKSFKDDPKNIIKTYSTTGGIKKRYN